MPMCREPAHGRPKHMPPVSRTGPWPGRPDHLPHLPSKSLTSCSRCHAQEKESTEARNESAGERPSASRAPRCRPRAWSRHDHVCIVLVGTSMALADLPRAQLPSLFRAPRVPARPQGSPPEPAALGGRFGGDRRCHSRNRVSRAIRRKPRRATPSESGSGNDEWGHPPVTLARGSGTVEWGHPHTVDQGSGSRPWTFGYDASRKLK